MYSWLDGQLCPYPQQVNERCDTEEQRLKVSKRSDSEVEAGLFKHPFSEQTVARK